MGKEFAEHQLIDSKLNMVHYLAMPSQKLGR